MAIKTYKPTGNSLRHKSVLNRRSLSRLRPKKSLLTGLTKKRSGRNSTGHITVRHHGGGHKQLYRRIDFRRDKKDIMGIVRALEYDPNRSANIALVVYPDGDQRYIIAPDRLKAGDQVISADQPEINPGNCMPLKNIPVGTPIHNLELFPGKGGQLVRSAGSSALIQSKEGDFAAVSLPSKEIRLVKLACLATIGQVSNPDHQATSLGKAGLSRHLGRRPTVRGTAQHPDSHPHGGGEGRSGVGLKYPKTPWGKHALGTKTRRRKKYSRHAIIKDRRAK